MNTVEVFTNRKLPVGTSECVKQAQVVLALNHLNGAAPGKVGPSTRQMALLSGSVALRISAAGRMVAAAFEAAAVR